jgi:hypothetical protein
VINSNRLFSDGSKIWKVWRPPFFYPVGWNYFVAVLTELNTEDKLGQEIDAESGYPGKKDKY